ncbi:hypothetical protein LEQ41_06455 [Streptococcus agalactiae]|nr:hypothetical protein [Streptococcus agalactiae]
MPNISICSFIISHINQKDLIPDTSTVLLIKLNFVSEIKSTFTYTYLHTIRACLT